MGPFRGGRPGRQHGVGAAGEAALNTVPFCVPITLQAYLQASDISLTITCFQVELCTSSRNRECYSKIYLLKMTSG